MPVAVIYSFYLKISQLLHDPSPFLQPSPAHPGLMKGDRTMTSGRNIREADTIVLNISKSFLMPTCPRTVGRTPGSLLASVSVLEIILWSGGVPRTTAF
jgi:hypothetical protein